MSFSQTSHNIRLENGLLLQAFCQKCDGTWQQSALDIHQLLVTQNPDQSSWANEQNIFMPWALSYLDTIISNNDGVLSK